MLEPVGRAIDQGQRKSHPPFIPRDGGGGGGGAEGEGGGSLFVTAAVRLLRRETVESEERAVRRLTNDLPSVSLHLFIN